MNSRLIQVLLLVLVCGLIATAALTLGLNVGTTAQLVGLIGILVALVAFAALTVYALVQPERAWAYGGMAVAAVTAACFAAVHLLSVVYSFADERVAALAPVGGVVLVWSFVLAILSFPQFVRRMPSPERRTRLALFLALGGVAVFALSAALLALILGLGRPVDVYFPTYFDLATLPLALGPLIAAVALARESRGIPTLARQALWPLWIAVLGIALRAVALVVEFVLNASATQNAFMSAVTNSSQEVGLTLLILAVVCLLIAGIFYAILGIVPGVRGRRWATAATVLQVALGGLAALAGLAGVVLAVLALLPTRSQLIFALGLPFWVALIGSALLLVVGGLQVAAGLALPRGARWAQLLSPILAALLLVAAIAAMFFALVPHDELFGALAAVLALVYGFLLILVLPPSRGWITAGAILQMVLAGVGFLVGVFGVLVATRLLPVGAEAAAVFGGSFWPRLIVSLILLLGHGALLLGGVFLLRQASWAQLLSATVNGIFCLGSAVMAVLALIDGNWLNVAVAASMAIAYGYMLAVAMPPTKVRFALAFALLSPAIVGLCLLVIYPMGYEVALSFSDMSLRRFKDDLLFSVGTEFVAELDRGELSGEIREQFRRNGEALSAQAVLQTEEPGGYWTIADGDTLFAIQREGRQLSAYKKKGPTYGLAQGWENFANVFTQPVLKQVMFLPSLRTLTTTVDGVPQTSQVLDPGLFARTVLWTGIQVPCHVIGGLLLALLLNRPMKLRGLYRTLLVIPWALPPIIAVLAWRGEFHYNYGFLNIMLKNIGLQAVQWKSDPVANFAAMNLVNIWLGIPFMMVILLGGLQSIPGELYEAAEIDGATWWQQFRKITYPLLQPVMTPAIILGVIWTFNNFNVSFFINENELESSDLLVTALFRAAFEYNRYGFAAAFALVIFVILLVFSIFYIRFTGAMKGVTET